MHNIQPNDPRPIGIENNFRSLRKHIDFAHDNRWLGPGAFSVATPGSAALRYNADNLPSSGLYPSGSDELRGGFSLGYRTFNSGEGLAWTAGIDRGVLTLSSPIGGDHFRGVYFDTPGAADWRVAIKCRCQLQGNNQAGLLVLLAGTEATPTLVSQLALAQASTSIFDVSYTDYSGGGSSVYGSLALPNADFTYRWHYLQITYTHSSKAYTTYWSPDGLYWTTIHTRTLAADPLGPVGLMVDAANTVPLLNVEWIRTFNTNTSLNVGQ
jgi:hypothetical protein